MLHHMVCCKLDEKSGLVSALTNNNEGGCVSFLLKEKGITDIKIFPEQDFSVLEVRGCTGGPLTSGQC